MKAKTCLCRSVLTVATLAFLAGGPAFGQAVSNQVRICSASASGDLEISGVFTNGICTLLAAEAMSASWYPLRNVYTTHAGAAFRVPPDHSNLFYRALARNLDGGRAGFTNLTQAYGRLSTLAGAGGLQDFNNWRPEFEGAPATNVLLSGPHIAIADPAGAIYIADKDAHGIRKIRLDGTVVTVAGINAAGDGPDAATAGTSVALNQPNGLWILGDGTIHILDLGNGKVRRLDTNGIAQTLFTVPGGILGGRGLWVSEDETRAYVSSLTVVKQWTAAGGVVDLAAGFAQLGNLVMDPWGNLVVTDRGAHRVYRLDGAGARTVIAGNGTTTGGGDGYLATATALNEVRGVWFLPTGGYLLVTHRGSQVWYVDTAGYIHLFLNGDRYGAHAGDGTWFYRPSEPRVSECRAVTMDSSGHLLITENDIGYVRRVEFLPCAP